MKLEKFYEIRKHNYYRQQTGLYLKARAGNEFCSLKSQVRKLAWDFSILDCGFWIWDFLIDKC